MASPVSDPHPLAGPAAAPGTTPRDARDALLAQSAVARSLGSAFVGEVLAAAYRQLGRAPRLAATIAAWPLDPAASAMALRLNAGLHALARRGTLSDLSALYAGQHGHFDRAVGEALAEGEATLLVWMSHPTQTNEVRRSSAFMAALSVLADRYHLPFELFEIGASAGLNLLLDRFSHDLGGVRCGDPASTLQLVPTWRGEPPPSAPVRIVAARGGDLRPLSLDDSHTRERLMSYVWPGDDLRSACLREAMAIARVHKPTVDRASAAPWLAQRLSEPRRPGTMRIVTHSMVLQYLPREELRAVTAAILHAGRAATPELPFARIGLEWNKGRTEVLLCMTCWDGLPGSGRRKVLAACHPYGASIDWRPATGHA